jgi:hypothetical protein
MILHAAHAAIVCLISCKTALHPGKQSPLLLTKELWSSRRESTSIYCIRTLTHSCRKIYPSTLLVQSPLTPKPESRAMTAHELVMFQDNPDILHGKKFVAQPNTDNSAMYEVINYSDRSIEYEVLFENLPQDPIVYNMKDMQNMLCDSYYIPA